MIQLRQEILQKLPELEINRGRPMQVLWFVALLPALVFLSSWIIQMNGHLGLKLGLSLVLGAGYSTLGLFGHELLHGTILRGRNIFSRIAMRLMAWFCFLIFGLSPELWLTWHNRVHHFHTNESGIDPDSFGLISDFSKYPMQEFLLARAPGSKHWLGWAYLPINFSNQVLSVWYLMMKGNPNYYRTVNRTVAVIETALMYIFWAAMGLKVGWLNLVWIFLIPLLVANLVVSSYILVQHLLCPLSPAGATASPLENTLGVVMVPGFEKLHFNFGYHVEHHIFPELNHVYFPKLREYMIQAYPSRYRLMSHVEAIRLLLKTPRVYRDSSTLFRPLSGESFDVSSLGLRQTR